MQFLRMYFWIATFLPTFFNYFHFSDIVLVACLGIAAAMLAIFIYLVYVNHIREPSETPSNVANCSINENVFIQLSVFILSSAAVVLGSSLSIFALVVL